MNPVFQYCYRLDYPDESGLPLEPDHLWYFWDETWASVMGGYETCHRATDECNRYVEWLYGCMRVARDNMLSTPTQKGMTVWNRISVFYIRAMARLKRP